MALAMAFSLALALVLALALALAPALALALIKTLIRAARNSPCTVWYSIPLRSGVGASLKIKIKQI